MDLSILDIDELFRLEVAEGTDEGFGGGADILGDVFAGDGEGYAGVARLGAGLRDGEFCVNIQ